MWVKLDDRFWSHEKVIEAGLEATGLYIKALCWCAQNETDGVISQTVLATMCEEGRPQLNAPLGILTDVGLFDEIGDKRYQIHDYEAHNKTKAELAEQREADRKRKAAGGTKSRKPPSSKTSARNKPGIRKESKRNPKPSISPVPSRPVPKTPNSQQLKPNARGTAFQASQSEEQPPEPDFAKSLDNVRALKATT